jgi:N-acetylmuramoyl-L-alanine amidase
MEKKILTKKPKILWVLLFFVNFLFAGNEFVKSEIRKAELKLYFSSDIERVTYFAVPTEEGITKYVYDIHGGVLPQGKGISHHSFRNIESFKIGQNSPTRLRVVIRSKQKALDKHAYRDNILAIPLIYGQTSTLKGGKTIDNSRATAPKIKKRKDSKQSKRYTVVIDAGHGGKDNGASCCEDRKEKEIVLSVAQRLKDRLERLDYQVYMTRDDDTFVKLPKRTEFANQKNADIFVSIHANAAPNKKLAKVFRGLETYYLSPAQTQRAKEAAEKENSVVLEKADYYTKNAYISLINREKIVESHKLGLDINRYMLRNLQEHYGEVEDGGVKPANFWVLVGALMPAVLVEIGYITHPKEGENLEKNYYQKLLAKGIAEGIERYLSNIHQ